MGEGDGLKNINDGGAQRLNKIEYADVAVLGEKGKPPMKSQDVHGFIGKSISLPASWNRSENNMGGQTMTTFSSPTKEATLSLFDRGLSVQEQSATYYKQLLADNASISAPKVLMPQQIRNLADVMGISNAGDNQFTNSHSYPDPKSPAFHLSSAQLIPLNGHVAVEVQGNYVDQSGQAGKQFRGIFVSAGSNGDKIREFFLQADNVATFAKHEKEYREVLKTIKW
jgi:hypothetical protein